MDVGERKRKLRERAKAVRRGMDVEERAGCDALIAAGVLASRAFVSADMLLCYLSFGSEVETRRIIRQALALGKSVALPRCAKRGHELEWYLVERLEGLTRNPLGMEEPDPTCHKRIKHDRFARTLCIVPGLVFDRSCYRLGYGSGYYDRFLTGFAGTSMGLCREALMVDELEGFGVLEPHDLPVDIVMSEELEYHKL